MLTFIILAAFVQEQALAVPAAPQSDRPIPPYMGISWRMPSGVETAEYQCGVGPVRLKIERPASEIARGRVSLLEWNVSGRPMAADQLQAWNDQLAELNFYQGYSVACSGDFISLSVSGYSYEGPDRTSRPANVSAIWGREGAWMKRAGSDQYSPF